MSKYDIDRPELSAAFENGNIEELERATISYNETSLSSWIPGYSMLCLAIESKKLEMAKLLIRYGVQISCGEQYGSPLHSALIHGDLELIDILVKKGCSLTHYDEKGMTPIHTFTQRFPVDDECCLILDYLLQEGVNINLSDCRQGFTPIHYAVKYGNDKMISLLLSKNAHIDIKAGGKTPLHVAAFHGQTAAVSILLEHGACTNVEDYHERTPLCLAVEKQNMTLIEIFLTYFDSFSAKLKYYEPPIKYEASLIYTATATKNASLVEILLLRGADPDYYFKGSGKTPLHLAVENGSEEIVKLLLRYGATPNATLSYEPKNHTALHIAAEKSYEEIFKILLQYGCNPRVINEYGQVSLHFATRNESISIVFSILNSGYDVSTMFTREKGTGHTPLHIAAQAGNLEIVQLLLRHGADPNAKGLSDVETPLYCAAEGGNSDVVDILSEVAMRATENWIEGFAAMLVAAHHGHTNVVNMLLYKGVNPNARIRKYLSPLHAAAEEGHVDIVRLLLDHRAEVNPRRKDDQRFSTPLIAAAHSGHEEIVNILLDCGAEIDTQLGSIDEKVESKVELFLTYGCGSLYRKYKEVYKEGFTPIYFAAGSGKKSIIEMLMKRGADVNGNKCIGTPLCVAVKQLKIETVAYLLESGADPEAKVDGWSPLFLAISKGSLKIVEILLEYIDPLQLKSNSIEEDGLTPLLHAIYEKRLDIVDFFLRKGAAVNSPYEDKLPLHVAINVSSQDIINRLIDYGASIESTSISGLTPLFDAFQEGRLDVFKMLLKRGASFEKKSEDGYSLLLLAIRQRIETELFKFLLECGADVNEKTPVSQLTPIELLMLLIETRKVSNDEDEDMFEKKCEYVDEKKFELLLQYGSVVNIKYHNLEESLLSAASTCGIVGGTKLLLRYGADVNFLYADGRTPFSEVIDEASDWPQVDSEDELEHPDNGVEGEKYDLDSDDFPQESIDSEVSFFERTLNFRKIARFWTQEIARIEASCKKVNENLLSLVKSNFVNRFYLRCRKEIETLKQRIISDSVSYFNLLVASERQLVCYARNENIVETLQSSDWVELFPVYGEDLEARFKRGVDNNNLIELSVKFLNEIVGAKLPILIVEEIFSYLSSADMRNLCRIHNRFIFVSTRAKEFYSSRYIRFQI